MSEFEKQFPKPPQKSKRVIKAFWQVRREGHLFALKWVKSQKQCPSMDDLEEVIDKEIAVAEKENK